MTKLTITGHVSRSAQIGQSAQAGFTLIELLITLVLGLLISAAALALFLDSSRSLRIQEGADDVLDPAVFSLSYIENEVAMANLGTYKPITPLNRWAGVVLSATVTEGNGDDAKTLGAWAGMNNAAMRAANLFSANAVSGIASNVKSGGTALGSDRLVIQYQPSVIMTNCEGQEVKPDQMVVERFYTRVDTTSSTNEADDPNNLSIVLACNATVFNKPISRQADGSIDSATLTGIQTALVNDTQDTVLINRLDYFAFKLGVLVDDKVQYLDVKEYCKDDCDNASNIPTTYQGMPVVAIKLGMIARSNSGTGTKGANTFKILGKSVTLDNTDHNYFRRVYETTIRLKNGAPS